MNSNQEMREELDNESVLIAIVHVMFAITSPKIGRYINILWVLFRCL